MVKLTSVAQARQLSGVVPALAVERMVQFEGDDGCYDPEEHGYIMVLEEGDLIERDFPILGEDGLDAILEGEWLSPFEHVSYVREKDRRIFEATIPLGGDAMLVLIVPEAPWVDRRLLLVLDAEGQETA